ncbi:hypothetical protein BASA81_016876 [Batrachochytrium salamandrivorans]|nr:hypothetical protein BASA81_016876 [Batrachochytrium salamandrivorans]
MSGGRTASSKKKAKQRQESSVRRGFATTSIPKAKILDPEPVLECEPELPEITNDAPTIPGVAVNNLTTPGCVDDSADVSAVAHSQNRATLLKESRRAELFADTSFTKTESVRRALLADISIPCISISGPQERKLFQYLSIVATQQFNMFDGHSLEKKLTASDLELNQTYLLLEKIGFQPDDVEAALSAASDYNIDSLLQWMCLHIPFKRLPSSFVDKSELELNKGQPITDSTLEIKALEDPSLVDSLIESQQAHVAESIETPIDFNQDHSQDVFEKSDSSRIDFYFSKMQEVNDDRTDTLSNSDFVLIDSTSITDNFQESSNISSCDGSDSEGAIGALFDLNISTSAPPDSQPCTSTTVKIMELSSPGWTGQMPTALLQQWISKNSKGTEMVFSQLKCHIGFRCSLRLKNNRGGCSITDQVFEMDESEVVENKADSRHYIATKALFHYVGGQQTNQVRNLPLKYADLWRAWEFEKVTAAEDRLLESGYRRVNFIQSISQTDVHTQTKESEPDVDAEPSLQSATSTALDSVLLEKESRHLLNSLASRKNSTSFQKFLKTRSALPVYSYKSVIVNAISKNQVVVLSGDTGSGKSTQVPQFILKESILAGSGALTNIICTQPRRISAVSLAHRVSDEIVDSGPPGSASSWVGYQVRLENKTTKTTRLTFCTTGVLLRRMESDTMLAGISHVIVDEVHERTLDSDFLLFLLKRLLYFRPDLRVVLMSATADADFFSAYFERGSGIDLVPSIIVPGKTFPVDIHFLEDAIQKSGYVLSTSSEFAIQPKGGHQNSKIIRVSGRGGTSYSMTAVWEQTIRPMDDDLYLEAQEEEAVSEGDVSNDSLLDDLTNQYDKTTLRTVSLMDPRKVNYELIEHLIYYIIGEESEQGVNTFGSILVFLPGFAEIRRVNELLESRSKERAGPKLWVISLHSTLTAQEQSLVFEPAPQGSRKIVLSTNVAETGITIPDVVYVIDSGRAREVCYDERRKMRRLADVLISKANCKQRAGRAGRVRPGQCFHLIPRATFDSLPASRPPEMLRLELEEICLRARAILGPYACSGSLSTLFSSMPEPPPETRVQRSLDLLNMVKALDNNENLTRLGRLLANLPLDVRLGKMLLFALFFNCLEPVLTICAVLSLGKSPFLSPIGQKGQASEVHDAFRRANSDLLSYAYVFDRWLSIVQKSKRSVDAKQFCDTFFLSSQNLEYIRSTREQLRRSLISLGFSSAVTQELETMARNGDSANLRESVRSYATPLLSKNQTGSITDTERLVQAIFSAALYPNILVLDAPANMHEKKQLQLLHIPGKTNNVSIHRASMIPRNALVGPGWYTYHAIKVEAARSGTTTSQKATVLDINETLGIAVVLFCGKMANLQPRIGALNIDKGHVIIKCPPRTCTGLMALRKMLDESFDSFLKEPSQGITERALQAISCFKVMIEQ